MYTEYVDLVSSDDQDDSVGDGVEGNPVDWAKDGQTTGHAFIGQLVVVTHDGDDYKGAITMWIPANSEVEDEPGAR